MIQNKNGIDWVRACATLRTQAMIVVTTFNNTFYEINITKSDK